MREGRRGVSRDRHLLKVNRGVRTLSPPPGDGSLRLAARCAIYLMTAWPSLTCLTVCLSPRPGKLEITGRWGHWDVVKPTGGAQRMSGNYGRMLVDRLQWSTSWKVLIINNLFQ